MATTKAAITDQLVEHGIIAVVRARTQAQAVPLAEALVAGGVRAIEITLTTPNGIEAIREVSDALGDRGLVGVGTVLDAEAAQAAIDAGAQFVVTPVLRPELVPLVHRADKPIMLGAYSPTEAQTAFEAGADFVKIFPADGLGPNYIKAIRAPLPHLRVVPTGGVNLDTMESFLKVGCAALGVGSSMIASSVLAEENWDQLTESARTYSERLAALRKELGSK